MRISYSLVIILMEDIKNIVESILFVSKEPLSVKRIKNALPLVDSRELNSILKTLLDEYEERSGGIYIRETAGGYQFCSRPAYAPWITKLIQPMPVRLSKPALETLAIIAYKQPIIRSDIDHIRGVDSGGIVRTLMERRLIRILGRKEIPGRPLIYATTPYFLEVFDLKDLKDLPSPKELEEIGKAVSKSTTPEETEAFESQSIPQASENELSFSQQDQEELEQIDQKLEHYKHALPKDIVIPWEENNDQNQPDKSDSMA